LKSKSNHKNRKGIYNGISEYSALIYCAKCGSPYYSDIDRGRHFYRCKTKKEKGTRVCNSPNISLVELDETITAELYNERLYYTKLTKILVLNDFILYLENRKKGTDFNKIENLENELKELDTKNSRLLDAYMEGIITKEEFKRE